MSTTLILGDCSARRPAGCREGILPGKGTGSTGCGKTPDSYQRIASAMPQLVPLQLPLQRLQKLHYPMTTSVLLEVCVDSIASAIAAESGGAHRLELCANLPEGGVTPSAGIIAMVRKRVSIPLHVLVRPRHGDFCYTPDEFEVMKRDIVLARQLGANGVVLGILTPASDVDVSRTNELIRLARPLSVTFHRAFDMITDHSLALENVIHTGANRLLTSGGAPTAAEGAKAIAELVAASRDRLTIMACGKIRETNVRSLLSATGVQEVHANLQSPQNSEKGSATDGEYAVVHCETVVRFLAAVGRMK